MPRHHLTLAALATAALPGLDVARAQPFTGGGEGEFDSALVTGRDGAHLVVRVPATAAAAHSQDSETRSLTALTAGVRARLPFAVTTVRGVGVTGGRGSGPLSQVRDYLPGQRVRPEAVTAGGPLAASLGAAIAALHALPTGIVAEAGLPRTTSAEALRSAADLVERAAACDRVPPPVLARWRAAVGDTSNWQYRPVVIHGALTIDRLLSAPRGAVDERVTGVLGWEAMGQGDPARDLAWTLALPGEAAAGSVFAAYSRARGGQVDRELRQRAMLYAELEIGRWLLHGLERGLPDVVRDAETMLGTLLDSVRQDTAGSLLHETIPVLSVEEVQRMLDDRRQSASRSHPASD